MVTQTSVEELYAKVVKALPPSERLKLATMILNDIPPQAVVDYSEEWSEEDIRDFSAASWNYALKQEEAEGDAPTG
jgi:hypothetical protein